MTHDCLALAITCDSGRSIYAHVDDLHDPEEGEITGEEIHVSLMASAGPEALVFCFKLSTTSANVLINDLCAAIARRKGGEPWDH
jgi:hypothetical protein